MWRDEDAPVLYIASDDPGPIAAALSNYHPVTARDLGVTLPPRCKPYGYFIDHYILGTLVPRGHDSLVQVVIALTALVLYGSIVRSGRTARTSPDTVSDEF